MKLNMYLKIIFDCKPHLRKLVVINHHLVFSMQHDPGELRGF